MSRRSFRGAAVGLVSAVVLTTAAGGVVAFADGDTAADAHVQTVGETLGGSATAADALRDSTAASKADPSALLVDHRRVQSAVHDRKETVRQEAAKARAAAEKAAREKAAREKAAREKAAQQKAAREKAAREKAAQQKAAREKASQAKTERSTRSRVSRSYSRGELSPSGARSLGRSMAAARGWGSGQFQCLDALWTHESGWNMHAENPSSGAYGIPQALPGSKMASAGGDWRSSASTQIEWGLNYIRSSYGTPCGAWSRWQARGWY